MEREAYLSEKERVIDNIKDMYLQAEKGARVVNFSPFDPDTAAAVRRVCKGWYYKDEGYLDGESRENWPIDTLYSDGRVVAFVNVKEGFIAMVGGDREEVERSIECVMIPVFQNLKRDDGSRLAT